MCDDQSRREIEVREVERIFFLVNNPKHHVELAHVKIKSCPQMKDGNRNDSSSRGTRNTARGGRGGGQLRPKVGTRGGGRKVSPPHSSQRKEGRWAKPECRGKGSPSPHRGQQRYRRKEGEWGMSKQEEGRQIRRNRTEPSEKRMSGRRKGGEREHGEGSEHTVIQTPSSRVRSAERRPGKPPTPRWKGGPHRGRQWEFSEFSRRPPDRRERAGVNKRPRSVPHKAYEEGGEGAPPRMQRGGEGSEGSSTRREREGKGRTFSSRSPSRDKGVKQRKPWSKKRIGVQSLPEKKQRSPNRGNSNKRSSLSEGETSKRPPSSQRGKKGGGARFKNSSVRSQNKRVGSSQGGVKGPGGDGKRKRASARDL